MGSKVCYSCKTYKSLESFHKSSRSRDGLRGQCKECRRREYLEDAENLKAKSKSNYYSKHEEKIQFYRNRYKTNKDKILKSTSDYKTNKRRNNPMFNFQCGISRRLRLNISMKKVYTEKSMMYLIVGITGRELINHLNSTFEYNYGLPRECIKLSDVEIDHIIPLSTAQTIEDVRRLNHYTNLQLLFKEDNQAKGTKLTLDLSPDLV